VETAIMGGASLLLVYLAVVPVATMIYASLHSGFLTDDSHWSLANYATAFGDPTFYRLLGNSALYGGGVALLAVALGFGLAFLYARTDAPLRGLGMTTALVPLILPGILNTVSWLFLASPRIGLLNAVSQAALHLRPFNVYSLPGMIFVQTMHVAPTAFILAVATFTSMDPSMEEAAVASGAGPLTAFRRITLALARPAIVAAALLVFIQTIASFEVPQLVGVPGNISVFTSQIYAALQQFPPDYGGAAAMGGVVLVIAGAGVAFANRLNAAGRHATVTGKAFRPRRIELGRLRWLAGGAILVFFGIAVVLPLGVLVWSSLLPTFEAPSMAALRHVSGANYAAIWSYPLIRSALINSTITSLSAGAIVTVLTAIVAYVTLKSRVRGAWVLDVLVSLPIAVPSILMGVGILFWYLVAPLPFHLYGTLLLLIVGFVTIGIPYGMRYASSGLSQIRDELEEAAAVSGAGWVQRFTRIYVPLLMPSLIAGFLTTVIIAFREISAAIFLYSQGSEVVSIAIFDLWSNGQYPVIAALGCVLVVLLVALVAVVQRLGGRLGIGTAP
jgi:iron(III) transport system permease protein